jgi:hypothetical protein
MDFNQETEQLEPELGLRWQEASGFRREQVEAMVVMSVFLDTYKNR